MGECLIKRNGGIIDVSGLTATPSDVVGGATFYGSGSADEQVGSIANNGKISKVLSANETYTIPAGFVETDSKVTQNIQTQGAVVITPTQAAQTVSVGGKYMTGKLTVNGVENLLPENIKNGVAIGTVQGTWQGYVNNDPLTPYWYGIFAPGQTGTLIANRSPGSGYLGSQGIDWASGNANPDGQFIFMYSSATSDNSRYPAFRFDTPIEMEGVKSVSIMYALPSHSANSYTWIVLAEKQVSNVTGGATWTLSESNLGAHESFVLPATYSSDDRVWATKTFALSNAASYKYIYVGIGVAASSSQGRNIAVKYVKLNK
uniref:Tail protein n=1 Tax=Dulem virus 35 TaxID=3145753 RepID=A0AAU8AYR7_9CAUD